MDSGEHGEEEIKEDEGIWIPGAALQKDVEAGIDDENDAEDDDEGPGAAEAGYGVGDAFAEGGFLFDHGVGVAAGAELDEALGGVELAAEDGEHVETGEGFALDEGGNVVAVELDAEGLFVGHGVGLVGRLVEHGGEAEEAAMAGLVDQNFLLIFVDGGDADAAGEDDVGAAGGLVDLENALAWEEADEVDLGGEDGELFFIEELEEGDVAEFLRVAGHVGLSWVCLAPGIALRIQHKRRV